VHELIPSLLEEPIQEGRELRGCVVTIDHFGNLITNIDERQLADLRRPLIRVAGRQFNLQDTYGRVQPGDFLALINSFGVVEIARAEGSAADGLGLGRGAPVFVSDDY